MLSCSPSRLAIHPPTHPQPFNCPNSYKGLINNKNLFTSTSVFIKHIMELHLGRDLWLFLSKPTMGHSCKLHEYGNVLTPDTFLHLAGCSLIVRAYQLLLQTVGAECCLGWTRCFWMGLCAYSVHTVSVVNTYPNIKFFNESVYYGV